MKKVLTFVLVAMTAMALNAKQVRMVFNDATAIESYGITLPDVGKGTNLSETPFTVDGITFSCAKVAKTDTRIWNSSGNYDLRSYVNNTITLTSNGENIKGVVFSGSAPTFFAETSAGSWTGDAKSITFTATATVKITEILIYVGENPIVETIDTLNVAEMIALIDAAPNKKLSKKACVIGQVGGIATSGLSQYGDINVWLGDIREGYENDTIEAYNMLSFNGAKYLEESEIQFGEGDTIVVYSASWEYFSDDKNQQYEASRGCYLAKVYGKGNPKPIEIPIITVAEALEIGEALQPAEKKTASTTEKYDVRGYIVGISEKNANTYFLADEKDVYGEFQAYKCATVDGNVEEGAFVSVVGKIANYHGVSGDGEHYNNIEISGGALVVISEAALENVKAAGKAVKTIENGQFVIEANGVRYNVLGTAL